MTPSRHATLACTACLLACALPCASLRALAPSQAQLAAPADTARPRRQPPTLAGVTVRDSVAARHRRSYQPGRTTSATRTDALLRDVPQAVTVIGTPLLRDQAMRGMADVVRYVPGITMGQGEGHRDAPTIRGQASTADFFVDGIRDDAQYYRDVYNAERIEALKGPNAMTFGRGGGGGVINRVTKGAGWQPVRTIDITGGSFDQRRTTLDVGQGLTRAFAARLNGLYEHGATFRDESGSDRIGVNPTAALLAGGALIRLGYEFLDDRRVVDRGVPSFRGAPAPAPITTFFGDPDASRSTLTVHGASLMIERPLLAARDGFGGLQLRTNTRVTTYDKFYQNVFPGAVDTALTTVALQGYNTATDRSNVFSQADLTTTVTRGAVTQALLVGTEFGAQHTGNRRTTAYFGSAGSTVTTYQAPFRAPTVRVPAQFRPSATDADGRTTYTTQAAYAQNQFTLGAHVQGLIGLRIDRLALRYTNRRTGQVLTRTDVLSAPRAGLVLKPVVPLSVYGSLGVSYLPGSGDQFGALTVTTQALEPEQFTNREVGVKWDATPALTLTAALYRLDRTNTTAPDPLQSGVVVQTGAQRTTGWEAGVSGEISPRWQVAGGYANQVATITARTTAAAAGARVPLVPRHTLSFWNRVQPVRRLGLGAGVVYQSAMFTAIDNTVTLPGFTRVDGALFLSLTRAITVQANVENLLDVRYYATAHSNNNIMPGSSRLVRVAVRVDR